MLNRLLNVFKSFQDNNVQYVVIGGIAAVLHGVPRAVGSVDLRHAMEATISSIAWTHGQAIELAITYYLRAYGGFFTAEGSPTFEVIWVKSTPSE